MSDWRTKAQAIQHYLNEEFPIAADFALSIDAMAGEPTSRLRLSSSIGRYHLRPGNIISGPTMMTLIDTTAYTLLIARGERGKSAVTTNLQVDFLRAAPVGRLVADAELLKDGRRSAVVAVRLSSPDVVGFIASATTTFAYL